MQITNKTTQFNFSKDIAGTDCVNYGDVSQNQDLTVDLVFAGDKLEYVKLITTCGCSVAHAEKSTIDYQWEGAVRYKAETLGTFSKVIIVRYKENGKDLETKIKLKGNVK